MFLWSETESKCLSFHVQGYVLSCESLVTRYGTFDTLTTTMYNRNNNNNNNNNTNNPNRNNYNNNKANCNWVWLRISHYEWSIQVLYWRFQNELRIRLACNVSPTTTTTERQLQAGNNNNALKACFVREVKY